MDFLWRRVSEKEKEEIRKQAKKIIDNFSSKLEKVKDEIKEEKTFDLQIGRDENNKECSEIDKEIMFENAPNKNKDFIIGERGEW